VYFILTARSAVLARFRNLALHSKVDSMPLIINDLIYCQAGKDAKVRKEQKRHERRHKEGKEDAEGVRFCPVALCEPLRLCVQLLFVISQQLF